MLMLNKAELVKWKQEGRAGLKAPQQRDSSTSSIEIVTLEQHTKSSLWERMESV